MKKNLTSPSIIFLEVCTNEKKLHMICSKTESHFQQGQKVQILVSNDEAAHYIDQLLWKYKPESFLPHIIAHKNTTESIIITKVMQNLNNGTHLINLCPSICSFYQDFECIYELLDKTQTEKEKQSQHRLENYQAQGLSIHFS